jgi:alpha-L-fucosidase
MQRRTLIKGMAAAIPSLWVAQALGNGNFFGEQNFGESIADGPFLPTWDSLQQYKVPDWYRNAKFGIWAHWGPQCQPEYGDWYARRMYEEGNDGYKYHVEKYGHPSKFGFKDVINEWKAENWNPEELLALYKNAGAQYFMALANHHDNFDLYNSKYQPWNSVKLGPKKDIIGGWAKAARQHGLKFGVSVHASHAWTWYEPAQRSDKTGPMAGISYDGKLTKKDGKGTWWNGFDPQDLYAQNHPLSARGNFQAQWEWSDGASVPSKAYCEKFFNRTIELINNYDPDVLYFDDNVLPLYPVSDVGLRIAAHLYNNSIKKRGSLQTVLNGKILNEEQRKCMVWDIERGQSNRLEPFVWQTDTCIGSWHYDRRIYDNRGYKSSKTVIQTLADIVSKNGNLMLSVPLRGDGTIDSQEREIIEGIGQWMKINGECIFDTRPWHIFGEGPAIEGAAPLNAQGFNEGAGRAFGATDIRFTAKGNTLYCIIMAWPDNGKTLIRSLAAGSELYRSTIQQVQLLGADASLSYTRNEKGLEVVLPDKKPGDNAYVLKIMS